MKDVKIGNQQATQAEIGWLAGIIDGEGYLGLSVSKKILADKSTSQLVCAMMHICNTDEEIVLRTQQILEKMDITAYVRASDTTKYFGAGRKIIYKIQVKRGSNMIRLLENIGSNLTGNKKQRGKLILEFCKSRATSYIRGSHFGHPFSDRELEIIEECLPLQRRGASETLRKTQFEKSKIAIEQNKRIKQAVKKIVVYCAECGKAKHIKLSANHHKHYFCDMLCRVRYQQENSRKYQSSFTKQAVMI